MPFLDFVDLLKTKELCKDLGKQSYVKVEIYRIFYY